ncbi:KGG domain-containing protein [Polyangium sp. y55x31]|uniref:KGG domain-containing protein n=1 Tax=Polyangium sp. y55x31 TaxID=3042688 RepID=UPI002482FDCD|nr:KGG domain-containing protein [Polyangium sp. y55x31]MDI1482094.1 KGG domain-containing protein [Polyangium sp. y55x31]
MAEQRKDEPGKGQMTVEEAGRKGGHIGGEHTRDKYGPEFYSEIGHKGGQRVRELIEEGKQSEGEGGGEGQKR